MAIMIKHIGTLYPALSDVEIDNYLKEENWYIPELITGWSRGNIVHYEKFFSTFKIKEHKITYHL